MRSLAILALPLLLAGCGGAAPALSIAVIAADAVSYSLSGKNVTDHAYSAITKRDCAMWRMIKKEPVCKDRPLPEGVRVARGGSVQLDPFVDDDPPRRDENVGPTGITELAKTLVTDRTTLTRNLKPLLSQKLLEVVDGTDRRQRPIALTSRGRDTLAQALPLWREVQVRIAEGLGRARWTGLLGDLNEAVRQAHAA